MTAAPVIDTDISKGAQVMLEYARQTAVSTVTLCSANRHSLAVELHGTVEFPRYLFLLWHADAGGEYRDLKESTPVKVTVLRLAGSTQFINRKAQQ